MSKSSDILPKDAVKEDAVQEDAVQEDEDQEDIVQEDEFTIFQKTKGWTKKYISGDMLRRAIENNKIQFLKSMSKNALTPAIRSFLWRDSTDFQYVDWLLDNGIDLDNGLTGLYIIYGDERFIKKYAEFILRTTNKNDLLVESIDIGDISKIKAILSAEVEITERVEDGFEVKIAKKKKTFDLYDRQNKQAKSPMEVCFGDKPSVDIINVFLDHLGKYKPADNQWLQYVSGKLSADTSYRTKIPYSRLATDFNLGNSWLRGRPSHRSSSF